MLLFPLLLTASALPSPAVVPAQDQDQEVRALFDALNGRDMALFPLRLPFSSGTYPGRDSGQAPDPTSDRLEQEGWVWWSGEEIRANFQVYQRGAAHTRTTVVSIPGHTDAVHWDQGEASDDIWPAVKVSDRAVGGSLEVTIPIHFGLGFMYAPWSEVLRLSSDVHALGRETVQGRDCLRVALSYGGALGGSSVPMDLWIDDRQSLLVMRVTLSDPEHTARRSGDYSNAALEELRFERYGSQLVPKTTWEVCELEQSGEFWLPAVGRIYSHGDLLPDVTRWTWVDQAAAEVQALRPELPMDLPPGGVHFDYVRGATRLHGGQGYELDVSQTSYWTVLEKAGQLGVREHGAAVAGVDFGSLNCGPSAALFLAHYHGRWCSLEELLDGHGVEEGAETNLQQLGEILHAQGLGTQPVHTSLEELALWSKLTLVHTRGSGPRSEADMGSEDHFMVVQVHGIEADDRVTYINPPKSSASMTVAQFREIWTGRALLVADTQGEVDAYVTSHPPAKGHTPMLIGVALVLATGTLILGRRGSKAQRGN